MRSKIPSTKTLFFKKAVIKSIKFCHKITLNLLEIKYLKMNAAYWVEKLGLMPHPEGGFFKETYQSQNYLPSKALPPGFSGQRKISTAIYFLLNDSNFSAFHKIKSDEIWHFYLGNAVEIFYIDNKNQMQRICLGNNPANNEVFQAVVPAGCWFGSRIISKQGYSLVGCTVAPGFDFQDFEMADRNKLVADYPQYFDIINQLTH